MNQKGYNRMRKAGRILVMSFAFVLTASLAAGSMLEANADQVNNFLHTRTTATTGGGEYDTFTPDEEYLNSDGSANTDALVAELVEPCIPRRTLALQQLIGFLFGQLAPEANFLGLQGVANAFPIKRHVTQNHVPAPRNRGRGGTLFLVELVSTKIGQINDLQGDACALRGNVYQFVKRLQHTLKASALRQFANRVPDALGPSRPVFVVEEKTYGLSKF